MILLRVTHRLWVRVGAIALLAVLAAALAPLLAPAIPAPLADRLGEDAVMPVLTILASGMLAVTTFSLNVMVTAYRAASAQATPRAYRILLEDTTTQTVLATFVGAFIFTLTAIILFRAGLYESADAVVVFGLTVIVVALIILAILRWVEHLSKLGSMDHTLDSIDTRTRTALAARAARPALGGCPMRDPTDLPGGCAPVPADRSGYVQFIDMERLQEHMAREGATAHVTAPPGRYVVKGWPLAHVSGLDLDTARGLATLFTIGPIRTFEQDARFGLVVLSEIGARALSPGVNDPGTAVDVILRMHKLLWETGAPERHDDVIRYPDVHVLEVTAAELVSDAFGELARDGAGNAQVSRRLLAALQTLSAHHDAPLSRAAEGMAAHLRQLAAAALDEDAALRGALGRRRFSPLP
ncbi:MAG: DUF2254 domain-containing protein [Paracoccaceae bacterium]